MRGLKDGYGLAGLIVILVCGFLVLDLGGPMKAAASPVKITSPAGGSVVSGTVPISLDEVQGLIRERIRRRHISRFDPSRNFVVINQCRQRHSYNFSRRLRLNQSTGWNFLQKSPRKKRTDSDRDTHAERRSDDFVAEERRDGFQHGVYCGAKRRTGQLG